MSHYNQVGSSFEQAAQLKEGSQVKALLAWQRQLQNHGAKTLQYLSSKDREQWCSLRACPGCLSPGSITLCIEDPEDISKYKTSPNAETPSNPRVRAQAGVTTKMVTHGHIILYNDSLAQLDNFRPLSVVLQYASRKRSPWIAACDIETSVGQEHEEETVPNRELMERRPSGSSHERPLTVTRPPPSKASFQSRSQRLLVAVPREGTVGKSPCRDETRIASNPRGSEITFE